MVRRKFNPNIWLSFFYAQGKKNGEKVIEYILKRSLTEV